MKQEEKIKGLRLSLDLIKQIKDEYERIGLTSFSAFIKMLISKYFKGEFK